MPTDLARIWFWLYPVFILSSAIYYGIKIFDYFRHKKLAQNASGTAQTKTVGLLKIEQRELSNRPPVILSIISPIFASLLLAFGIWIVYMWLAGIIESRADFNDVLVLILFMGIPLFILIDQFFIQPKYYKLGRSLCAKEAKLVVTNDADAVFDACHRALDSMQATIRIMQKPKLFRAKIKDSVITIKIRRFRGLKVGVYILSDSKWPTVRWDRGANQRNIDRFLQELSKQ